MLRRTLVKSMAAIGAAWGLPRECGTPRAASAPPPTSPYQVVGWQSMPSQDPVFLSKSQKLFVVGGNRSGVSTAGALLVSSLATRRSVALSDGASYIVPQQVPGNRPANIWVVGYDGRHISQTPYRVLFRKLREDAPPIMHRYVNHASWVWEDKQGRVFTEVEARDSVTKDKLATIRAFSSKAASFPCGDCADLIWVDGDVESPSIILDLYARLAPRGRLVCTGFPSERMLEMMNLAGTEDREVIHLSTLDNRHIEADALRNLLKMPANEHARRIYGQFA